MTGMPNALQSAPTAAQIREQVRQSIQDAAQRGRDAAQQAREAQQRVREAQQQVREAQQHVREAQQQVREARTADQQGAAQQALSEAQKGVAEAEASVRETEAEVQGSQHRVFQTIQPPGDMQNIIPPQAVDISIAFFIMCAVILIGWPLARAFGRRIERRSDTAMVHPAMADQLQRIEQAVDAMAIEIERISESQRFMAKLQSGSAQAHGSFPLGERR
jgi:hypothetical protein